MRFDYRPALTVLAALRSIEARCRHDPRGFVPEEAPLIEPGHNLLQTTWGP